MSRDRAPRVGDVYEWKNDVDRVARLVFINTLRDRPVYILRTGADEDTVVNADEFARLWRPLTAPEAPAPWTGKPVSSEWPRCPACKAPLLHARHGDLWACSDPACKFAHGLVAEAPAAQQEEGVEAVVREVSVVEDGWPASILAVEVSAPFQPGDRVLVTRRKP